MTKRENDAIWAAAEEANRKFGQWMPQLWIEIFIKELASTPPATSAGLGADEIARIIEPEAYRLDTLIDDPNIQDIRKEWAREKANAILALLSRAGDQSNSTQKDGSR